MFFVCLRLGFGFSGFVKGLFFFGKKVNWIFIHIYIHSTQHRNIGISSTSILLFASLAISSFALRALSLCFAVAEVWIRVVSWD